MQIYIIVNIKITGNIQKNNKHFIQKLYLLFSQSVVDPWGGGAQVPPYSYTFCNIEAYNFQKSFN